MDAASPSTTHQSFQRPPIPEGLLALAPTHLRNYRRERYLGDEVCTPLTQLAGSDQILVQDLYRTLVELLFVIVDQSTDNTKKWQDVARWVQRYGLDSLIEKVQALGKASHARVSSEELAKAMHDVRGGPLNALLGRLQLLRQLPQDEAHLQTLFVLVRDHLKIMRNAITGLDDARRHADRTPKSHDMQLMLDKWQGSVVGPDLRERPIRMAVDCHYAGALTECCLESAAMDRIFYNLSSNACRHASGERLELVVFQIPEPPGDNLRFVLSNEVGEEDAAYLDSLGAGGTGNAGKGGGLSLSALFAPEISSTGSGFGLTVVADFVTKAFGLRDQQEVLRERYVGAILDGRTFRVWFHWPISKNVLPQPKLDDFRHPEQSLDEPET